MKNSSLTEPINKNSIILGIESSCDETGIALYSAERGLLAHRVYSQTEIHQDFGGVVPELASRDHIRKMLPLLDDTLKTAGLTKKNIDGVAYTKGPGLVGALMVGATIGRSLAYALDVPALGVHHMEAHLLAVMLEKNVPNFPFIALIVSGGHTMLLDVQGLGDYQLLGQSLDDAVGEAFDKTAKLLGLPYPGGPELALLAEQGNPKRFEFPRPMLNRPGLDFSFSGLKTFAVNTFHNNKKDQQTSADIACAFEEAVVDTLLKKSIRALDQTALNRLIVVGGVGANKKLRERLKKVMTQRNGDAFFPRLEFCTDNAAMVAYTGYLRLAAAEREDLAIEVRARWEIS